MSQPLSHLADRELVARFLKSGGEDQFRELYRRHTPLVYRICVRSLRAASGQAVSAEDATQECWLRAVKALARFEWQSELSTWLVGIAIRVCAEFRRQAGAVIELRPHLDDADAGDSEGPAMDRIDVERLIDGLAPGYRAVIVLHELEGLTHAEVAAALQVSVGTVKSQLSRGRRALRALIALEPTTGSQCL